MFADLVGFTAWSSVREPSQVFTMLESLFLEFDKVAKASGVYKVETVGDCYVAVSGKCGFATIKMHERRDSLTASHSLAKELQHHVETMPL